MDVAEKKEGGGGSVGLSSNEPQLFGGERGHFLGEKKLLDRCECLYDLPVKSKRSELELLRCEKDPESELDLVQTSLPRLPLSLFERLSPSPANQLFEKYKHNMVINRSKSLPSIPSSVLPCSLVPSCSHLVSQLPSSHHDRPFSSVPPTLAQTLPPPVKGSRSLSVYGLASCAPAAARPRE